MTDITGMAVESSESQFTESLQSFDPGSTHIPAAEVGGQLAQLEADLLQAETRIAQAALQADALGEPFLFAQSFLPTGVVTDRQGNVFVSSENTFTGEDGIPRSFGSVITKYAPNGAILGQIQTGGLLSAVDVAGSNRFALDPLTGLIASLSPSGQINLINPDTGERGLFLELKSVPFQTNRVYDLATGQIADFSGAIQPALSSYGDIDIFASQDFFDIYVSGISAGQTFPFVARLRLSNTLGNSAQVLVSSRASAAPTDQSPPGVAVNNQGTVLTTLGINRSTAGNFSALVGFSVGFDPNQPNTNTIPRLISDTAVSSRGMTTDASGNFYIATGTIGTTLGGVGGSGAIVALSPQFELLGVFGQGAVASSQDVAVSPDGQVLYATVGGSNFGFNGVIGFPLATALPQGDGVAALNSGPQ